MALSEACPGLSQGSPHHQLPIGMKNNAHWPPSPGAGQQLHEQNYHSKNVPILSDLTADGASAQVPDPPSPPHLDLPRSFHCSQTPLLEHGQQCRNSLQSKLSFNLKHAALLLGCFQVLKRNDFKTITLLSLGNYPVCFFVHVSESDSPLRDPTSHPTGHRTPPREHLKTPSFIASSDQGQEETLSLAVPSPGPQVTGQGRM